jgi:hypothetical protein
VSPDSRNIKAAAFVQLLEEFCLVRGLEIQHNIDKTFDVYNVRLTVLSQTVHLLLYTDGTSVTFSVTGDLEAAIRGSRPQSSLFRFYSNADLPAMREALDTLPQIVQSWQLPQDWDSYTRPLAPFLKVLEEFAASLAGTVTFQTYDGPQYTATWRVGATVAYLMIGLNNNKIVASVNCFSDRTAQREFVAGEPIGFYPIGEDVGSFAEDLQRAVHLVRECEGLEPPLSPEQSMVARWMAPFVPILEAFAQSVDGSVGLQSPFYGYYYEVAWDVSPIAARLYLRMGIEAVSLVVECHRYVDSSLVPVDTYYPGACSLGPEGPAQLQWYLNQVRELVSRCADRERSGITTPLQPEIPKGLLDMFGAKDLDQLKSAIKNRIKGNS